jgi:putative ABC transport system substrate-binding protein
VLVVVLIISLLAAPLVAEAQPAGKVARVGFMSAGFEGPNRIYVDAFRERLRELGYVEGRSIAFEYRWGEGKYERLPTLAAELVRMKVDVILAANAPAVEAAKKATGEIPIVVTVLLDPVAAGLVASLARPGGNITGLSMISPELVGKHLELLKEVIPKISRVAVLGNPANPGTAPQMREAKSAAHTLGLQLQIVEARDPSEIDRAIVAMTRERAEAVLVLVDAMLGNHRERIAALTARNRLPSVSGLRLHAEAGDLMAYGANRVDVYHRAAEYVDRILKGARPGDIPIEQPTKFELIVNLKTARALGLTIPPSLLLRADQVIQ